MVGKYVELSDAYKSVNEGAQARRHAKPCAREDHACRFETITDANAAEQLGQY